MLDCLFCRIPEKLHVQILGELEHFYILHDGYPLIIPHVLVIPKEHTLCFGLLTKDILLEAELFLGKVKKQTKQLTFFEHGGIGQTVKHAHLHIIPKTVAYQQIISGFPKGINKKLPTFSDILGHSEYLLLGSTNSINLYTTNDIVEPGIITNTIADYVGVPYPMEKRAQVTKEMIAEGRIFIADTLLYGP